MDVEDFIETVNGYVPTHKPQCINIIFGISDYYPHIQRIKTNLKAYELFGSVAFILNNAVTYKGSDIRVWNILLGTKSDETVKIFTRFKSLEQYKGKESIDLHKLISYLYFEKGLLLLNRIPFEKSCFEYLSSLPVRNVLYLGTSVRYKSLAKFFPNAKQGVLPHPSNRARKTYIYETLDDANIKVVKYRRIEYPIVSFAPFKVLI